MYFSDTDRRDLYVFLSVQVDDDLFAYLEYVLNNYNDEKLTLEIVKNKVEELIKKELVFKIFINYIKISFLFFIKKAKSIINIINHLKKSLTFT
jgi:hypothetical protein